jgi:hypothetical protein
MLSIDLLEFPKTRKNVIMASSSLEKPFKWKVEFEESAVMRLTKDLNPSKTPVDKLLDE